MGKSDIAWKNKLRSVLRKKEKVISSYRSDLPSRRIEGALGRETEHMGFKAVIFYFKLSTLIDLELTAKLITEVGKRAGPSFRHQFATLFMNDPVNRFVYPRSMVKSVNAVNKIMREYYGNYAVEYEPFSGVMEQLFPIVEPYSTRNFPGTDDLCLIISDRFGVEINSQISKKMERLKKNWIYACLDKDRPVEIIDMNYLK